ncbi:hypothetical protein [Scytonema millei]|uniref:hypothetical protein n=1 Tax=Scytonema millei TaxID=1245922 RepID=UPI0006791567
MFYKASVLLALGDRRSLQDAEMKLVRFFTHKLAERSVSTLFFENRLAVTFDNWSLYIYLNSEPEVLKESQEIASTFAHNHPDRAVIATCKSRFEISSDSDPSMAHFNDYILVVEQLSELPGAFVFEHATQEFM